MREDWLSGGRQSPSQFIWHGCLGNKAVRQEAEKRCELLFVWITAKKLPAFETSQGYAISLEISSIQWSACPFFSLLVNLLDCINLLFSGFYSSGSSTIFDCLFFLNLILVLVLWLQYIFSTSIVFVNWIILLLVYSRFIQLKSLNWFS